MNLVWAFCIQSNVFVTFKYYKTQLEMTDTCDMNQGKPSTRG